jgi:hypothetical protein
LQREIDSRFEPDTAGVLDAALLGNRYNLTRATAARFREGGTFHVLVISGLHISFIGGVILFVLRRVTKRRLFSFGSAGVCLVLLARGWRGGVRCASGVDVYFRGTRRLPVSSGHLVERAWRRRDGFARAPSERDVRSVVSTDLSVGAGDRRDRVAVAAKVFSNRHVVSGWRHAVPAKLFARAQGVLRDLVLERASVAEGDGALYTSLPAFQEFAEP